MATQTPAPSQLSPEQQSYPWKSNTCSRSKITSNNRKPRPTARLWGTYFGAIPRKSTDQQKLPTIKEARNVTNFSQRTHAQARCVYAPTFYIPFWYPSGTNETIKKNRYAQTTKKKKKNNNRAGWLITTTATTTQMLCYLYVRYYHNIWIRLCGYTWLAILDVSFAHPSS